MGKGLHRAKKAAAVTRVKPERTASRLPAPAEKRMLRIEKDGKLVTWHVPTEAFKGEPNLRTAFVGGFEARVEQIKTGTRPSVPQRFEHKASQQAFEDGYFDAATQDGIGREPLKLSGSSSQPPAAPPKKAKRA